MLRDTKTNIMGVTYIPRTVAEKLIQTNFITKKDEQRGTDFVINCIRESYYYNGLLGTPVGYHWQDLTKSLGCRYKRPLLSLEDSDLLSIDHSYKKGEKTKRYSINISDDDLEFSKVFTTDKSSKLNIINPTTEILKRCKIDEQGALNFIGKYSMSDAVMKGITLNEDVLTDYFKKILIYNCKSRRFERSVIKINKKTFLNSGFNRLGFDMIQNKTKYYYAPKDAFMRRRRQSIAFSYLNTLQRFVEGDFYAIRDKMGRLHSNITNLPNVLLPFITFNNNKFRNLDLVCSQWRMFVYAIENSGASFKISNVFKANPLNKKSDSFKEFNHQVCQKDLYQFIADELGLENRFRAKLVLFEILFAPIRNNKSTLERELRKLFPHVTTFIDHFKRTYGYKEISRELQTVESVIFVDNILSDLQGRGLPDMSKHDSILSPEPYFSETKEIMTSTLDHFFGKGKYRLKEE